MGILPREQLSSLSLFSTVNWIVIVWNRIVVHIKIRLKSDRSYIFLCAKRRKRLSEDFYSKQPSSVNYGIPRNSNSLRSHAATTKSSKDQRGGQGWSCPLVSRFIMADMNLLFYWRNRFMSCFSSQLEFPLDLWPGLSSAKLLNAVSLAHFQTRPQQEGAVGLWSTMNNKKRSYPSLFKSRGKNERPCCYTLRSGDLIFVLQALQSRDWRAENMRIVHASPCWKTFNFWEC